MTSTHAIDTISEQSSNVSLYKLINTIEPEHRFHQPADALILLGHELQRAAEQPGVTADIVIGILRFSLIRVYQAQISQLAQTCRSITIYGEEDVPAPHIPGVEWVAIPATSPLSQEWFVLVNSAEFWGALIGQIIPDQSGSGRRFIFDSVLTSDERVVSRAHLLLNLMRRRSMPAIGIRDQYHHRAIWAEIAYKIATHQDSERLGLFDSLHLFPEFIDLIHACELPREQL
jgi:hypothetical protein